MKDASSQSLTLILMPSVMVYQDGNGELFITQKFIDGVRQYKQYWPGNIVVYVEKSLQPDGNLDKVCIDNITDFALNVVDFNSIEDKLASTVLPAVVLASIHYKQNDVARLCRKLNIRCVQTSEYTLNTRFQIIKTTRKNIIKRWRGYLWEYLQEKKNKQSIQQCDAVQCNGLPTYNAYKDINKNCMLYFDSRVCKEGVINKSLLDTRLQQCLTGKTLRLVFSGRLTAMKGADHLILFGKALRDLNVDFHLTICGDGDLLESMRNSVTQYHLEKFITLTGTLDFHSELLPFIKENADLFICCHRQGDPSCTYIETMSCGVPIISYDNEAFAGLQATCHSGWMIKMDHYQDMANRVKDLAANRQEITENAITARTFSLEHTFETTFSKRIDHLKNICLK